MYVNQINTIIDQMLDKLYLEGLSQVNPFTTIINEKKINFVEYYEQINDFIKNFTNGLDTNPIQKLINDKEKLQSIINIIKRYVAYYCFLYMAYSYAGNIKDFRNNLIQISKMQETLTYHIKNFYDTENNYQLTVFFKIISDAKKILLMTPLQKKTLNINEVKDAVDFLNTLGSDYIDNYILTVTDKEVVDINIHNLIKTIVLQEVYKKQEQNTVFKILSDIEESENEYIWIDIVVSSDELTDFNFYRNIFAGEKNSILLARDLYELANRQYDISQKKISLDKKNNNLLGMAYVSPIVDDFLRYHKDTEKLDMDHDKTFILSHFNKNNTKNVQLALIRQHRKKKENTKAQLIINKIDMITELYSKNVEQNPEIKKEIKKFFYGPLAYRKVVLHNYLDENYVMRKMQLQGKKAIERDEYYLELKNININAYFNFKDFQKYGTSLILNVPQPINMIRYSNIEFISQFPTHILDVRSGSTDAVLNMTGLSIGPFQNGPIQCMLKENLIDIRSVKIIYDTKNGPKELKTDNGYSAFMKIIVNYYIKTITLQLLPQIDIYNNFDSVQKINPDILDKVIYWIYDIEKDLYATETYENNKMYDFQENIKFMNGMIYDKIMSALFKKLTFIIKNNINLELWQIEKIINLFVEKYNLVITEKEKSELISREYLTKKPKLESLIDIISDEDRFTLIDYATGKIYPNEIVYSIKIDMVNPTHLQEYISSKSYLDKQTQLTTITSGPSELDNKLEAHCRHESDWKELSKLKKINLNEYNAAITVFMNKYAIETSELYYICRICGQFLPMKEFYQDGKFNNATQKYTTNYVPLNIPLNEIREYAKYTRTINHIDGLINKLSSFTGTNMLTGASLDAKLKRKTVIKNVIDIIVKHNVTNLGKPEFDVKLYGIDKNISSVFNFELSDSIYEITNVADPHGESEINRLKFNNIILYFVWIFITELNAVQILSMLTDKIANIYVVEKYGDKIFDGLFIKKNINGYEKVKITEYPVLCYVLYLISYYLVKYGAWYSFEKSTKVFNAFLIKGIVHSMVELFNGFSINFSKIPTDYVYSVTTSKIYTQLNSMFKNTDIIRLLRESQLKYSGKVVLEQPTSIKKIKNIESFKPAKNDKQKRIFTFKISTGIIFYAIRKLSWNYIPNNTNLSNCPSGDFHTWIAKDLIIMCAKCGEIGENISVDNLTDRTTESYYFNLNELAVVKCLEGGSHNFDKNNAGCTTCKKSKADIYSKQNLIQFKANKKAIKKGKYDEVHKLKTDIYTKSELDKMNANLKAIDIASYNELHQEELLEEDKIAIAEKKSRETMADLVSSVKKSPNIINTFISQLEKLLGENTNFGTESYPMYLEDDVYIINHTYTGAKIEKPITFTEKEGKIILKENHTFFNTDVFYYVNNEIGSIDVFYHAVTMKLIGYKEKHKDYVKIKSSADYLIVNRSIKNKLLNIGHKTRYINVPDIKQSTGDNITKYYDVLDNLIKNHIYTVREIVDKICSLLSKIKNYSGTKDETAVPAYQPIPKKIDLLIAKYASLIPDFKLGNNNENVFDSWNYIRDLFMYDKKIDWKKSNIRPTENPFINSDIINKYVPQVDLMLFYSVEKLMEILNMAGEKINKINVANLYIELINYIFELYNKDEINRIHDVKRFEYILNGSLFLIDTLKKGRGLINKELEKELSEEIEIPMSEEAKEEAEDAIEEAQALDVENQYYEDDTEDYTEATDYEE